MKVFELCEISQTVGAASTEKYCIFKIEFVFIVYIGRLIPHFSETPSLWRQSLVHGPSFSKSSTFPQLHLYVVPSFFYLFQCTG